MSTNSRSDDPRATAPMASGNAKPMDGAKADNAKPDRQSRSLVRDLPVGPLKPANSK